MQLVIRGRRTGSKDRVGRFFNKGRILLDSRADRVESYGLRRAARGRSVISALGGYRMILGRHFACASGRCREAGISLALRVGAEKPGLRLRFLKLRISAVAPKGQRHISPGQRPGNPGSTPIGEALKGRNRTAQHVSTARSVPPFQGLGHVFRLGGPGALPPAGLGLPLWGEMQIAQHQNLRFGSVQRTRDLACASGQ
jgi:hypothetical protein